MISVDEASSIILSNLISPQVKKIELTQSLGKILAEVVVADRDFPPFDRATMDGIAIQFESYQNGQRDFLIESVQAAGEAKQSLKETSHCIEIMTGAALPDGIDLVIPYENFQIVDGKAILADQKIVVGQNIHLQGSDAKQFVELLSVGTIITSAEVALLASIGKSMVTVFELPKAAIISTGNELVDIDQTPLTHQIRKSNSYALQAAYAELGGESSLFHLPDQESIIKKELTEIISQYDLIILSGGVSKGKFDFIPKALEELGIQKYFHQVSQKPGKPMWFGRSANTFVFALPGNPVSTFMCFHRYIKPWVLASIKVLPQSAKAILAEDYVFKAPLTYFLQVKLRNEEGKLLAYPVTGGGSGDFVNLKEVDGFLELPATQKEFKKEESFAYFGFR